MPQKIIKMTSNFKFLLIPRTMLFILEPSIWDLQSLNKQELFLIPVPNTWPSLQFYVMTKLQETINSKSTIHFKEGLSKETTSIKDAKPKLMICISLILIKSCQKPHQNWLTDPPNCKVLFGKTTLAFNLLIHKTRTLLNFNWPSRTTNALSSNS